MGSANPNIFDLGQLVSKKKKVQYVDADGITWVKDAYVYGLQCPIGVKSLVDQAYKDYRESVIEEVEVEDEETGEKKVVTQERNDAVAYGQFIERVLDALIIGIEAEAVSVLASNVDLSGRLLEYLEYIRLTPDEDENTEGDVVRESQTGA